MSARTSKAFFSYSREDSDFASRLASDLRVSGAPVWLDQLDIRPGERWDRSIEEALAECSRLIVILSPSSIASNNVMDEVSFALEEGRTVIPVLYRDCKVPFRLRRLQYVDFRHDYHVGLRGLLPILGVGVTGPQPPYSAPPYTPPEPPHYQGRAAPAWQPAPEPTPVLPVQQDNTWKKFVIGGGIGAVALAIALYALMGRPTSPSQQPPSPQVENPAASTTTAQPQSPPGRPEPTQPIKPVAKPSFPCTSPNGPIESLLCQDSNLANLDVRLTRAYADRLADLSQEEKPMLAADQKDWLAKYSRECKALANGNDTSAPGLFNCVDRNLTLRIYALKDWKPKPAPATPAPPPPQVQSAALSQIRVGGNVQAANLLQKVAPAYPPLAKTARIQGTVSLRAIIAKDGTVDTLSVISGHPLLVQAAMDAVKQWVYKPTLLNGEAVMVITQIDVNFTLSQ